MSTLQHTARRLRARLTYANVMSTLAVVLILGTGTAYAAGSIGSRQVIDNSLRSIDIRNDNLTGTDTRNGTLGAAELSDAARNQLLPGGGSSGGGSVVNDTDGSDGWQTIMSNDIAAGNQMVVFAGQAINTAGGSLDLQCEMTVNNGDRVGNLVDITVPAGATEAIAIAGGRDVFGSSQLVVACLASAAPGLSVSGSVMHVETETVP